MFILASASPRRREMLGSLGLRFSVEPSDADETPLAGEGPEEHTLRLAELKARSVARRRPGAWVLGADTTVVIDGLILGKPQDHNDAVRMLGLIQGRTHVVFSAFAWRREPDGAGESRALSTRVTLRSLTPAQTRWYVCSGEPLDKAGAYAIQGIGAALVERVEGSYTNVVGLPLAEVVQAAQRLGIFTLTDLR